MRLSMLFGALVAVIMSAPALARPLTIVEDGEPRAALVVEAESPKSLAAAKAIQTYVQRISGAELPLVTEGEAAPDQPVRILVGQTQAAKQAGVEIPAGFRDEVYDDAFEEEGYVVKSLDSAIVVAGNNDGPYQGTNYAAWRLLHELGCRWYFPGEWGEIVPEATTITVPSLDLNVRPDFAIRNIWMSGWVPMTREERQEYDRWSQKIGFSGRAGLYPTAGDGFLAYLVPPAEYFESNPEFFAMGEDGERKAHWHRGGFYYANYTMLCLSSEAMYQEAVKNLREAFAGERKMSIVTDNGFGISPPDGAPYCFCPECKAASQNFNFPRYVHRQSQSEEFFAFAARLAREFPDKFVGTMAYSLREIVPQGVDIPKNIAVTIAPISADVMHPGDTHLWRRRDFIRNLEAWRQRTPHIMIYDYNPGMLTGMWVPERDAENMAVNAKIYRDIDIKGMAREGRKAFMQTWLSYYATSKLLWNADADLDAIKQDFYTTFFGPAAGPHVRAWWDACAERLVESEMQAHEDFLINHLYDVEFARSIHPHIVRAGEARMTEAQRSRFEAARLIAEHFMAVAEMYDAEKRMAYAEAAEKAGIAVDLRSRLFEISPFLTGEQFPERNFFAEGRKLQFEELAAKTGGEKGELIAALPLEMSFQRDPFNEGIVGQWFAPDHDDRSWETRNTFYTWEQQEPNASPAGHDWDGYGWYRAEFDVPANVAGKPVKVWIGGAMNEAWVWVNGEYAGHREHKLWWDHAQAFELDVTDLMKPGETNTVAIRILNDAEHGGLFRRGFFYVDKQLTEAAAE